MPESCYLAAQVRELDRLAIEEHGIAGFTLMQRAGKAAFRMVLKYWPGRTALVCFCGSGNNGGDGYINAGLAKQHGLKASVIAVGSPDKLRGDARLAYEFAREQGVPVSDLDELPKHFFEDTAEDTVIVDALLGTGLTGEVRGDYAAAIALINRVECPVLAADIPSGLDSDTGKILGDAVNADVTVTFIGRKLGQVIGNGPACCGKLEFDDLAVPAAIYEGIAPATPE